MTVNDSAPLGQALRQGGDAVVISNEAHIREIASAAGKRLPIEIV